MKEKQMWKGCKIAGGLLGLGLLWVSLGATGVRAEDAVGAESSGHLPIVYVGTVMTNLIYFPTKLVYAGCGAVVGGIAYVLTAGDADALSTVWDASGGGTYFVTPGMLEGKESVHFIGP